MECFKVYLNEIEGRLDPFYYRPEFRRFDKLINTLKVKKLGDIAEFQYGLNETAKEKGDIIYIRITDIDEYGLLKKDSLAYLNYQDKYKGYKLKKGDLLITRIGATFGKSYYFNENFDAVFAGYLIRINLQNNEINSKYLFYFFQTKYFWQQANMLVKGGAQPQFNANTLKDILIPIPPLETQNRIVQIMDDAYSIKKSKEAEAQRLLDSIDDYVLSELGIKMPELKDKMTFSVYSDDIKGKRFDPSFYSFKYKLIEKSILKGKYTTLTIRDITSAHFSGDWGYLEVPNEKSFVKVKIIRNVNFDNNFNLKLDKLPERFIKLEKFNKLKLKKGDVLVEKSGGSPDQPVGRVALIDFDTNKHFFSNFVEKFLIDNEKCLSEYFFVFMKAIYKFGYTEKVQNQTTGIRNLIIEQFLDLKIPLPPLDIQNKIAEEVKSRMEKAKQLQKEAKETLEKAKQKVEDIILNGGGK